MQTPLRGRASSSSSITGSMSTLSREDNLLLSSEDSSSPDDADLELGLGLSLGGRGFRILHHPSRPQFARILTAKDFPSPGSSSSSSSSASSSSSSPSSSSASSSSSSSSPSSLSRADFTAGTKRSADSVVAANGAGNQVIGWPPIRAYRMNSMVHQAKSQATEELNSTVENKSKNCLIEKSASGGYKSNGANCNAKVRTSLFVKVNMDGIPIGRKVDLNSHGCYETLAQTLEDMFLRSSATANAIRSNTQEHKKITKPSKLLNGSSEFVLTYKDKEGDWMLVGDVPWGMFIGSVKRLRIMRTTEATGLDPSLQERNGRQRRN